MPEGKMREHEGQEVDLTKKVLVENADGIIEFVDSQGDTAEHMPISGGLKTREEILDWANGRIKILRRERKELEQEQKESRRLKDYEQVDNLEKRLRWIDDIIEKLTNEVQKVIAKLAKDELAQK